MEMEQSTDGMFRRHTGRQRSIKGHSRPESVYGWTQIVTGGQCQSNAAPDFRSHVDMAKGPMLARQQLSVVVPLIDNSLVVPALRQ